MLKVYFVRHAESVASSQKLHQRADSPLSENGKKQAKLVAKRLKNIEIDLVYTSPFAKALETANIINEEMKAPIEIMESFREAKRSTSIEGLQVGSNLPLKIEELARKNRHNPLWKYEDSETVQEMWDRTKLALNHLVKNNDSQSVLVVSHGITIRVFLTMALFGEKLNTETFHIFQDRVYIHNTSISCLEYDNNYGWRLVYWNDTNHREGEPTF